MQAEPRPETKRSRFALSLLAALATHATLLAVLPNDRGARPALDDASEPFAVELFEDAPKAPPPAAEAAAPAPDAPSEGRATSPQAPALARVAPVDKRPAEAGGEASAGAEASPGAGGGPGAEAGEGQGPRPPINFSLGASAGRAFALPTTAPPSDAGPRPPPDPAERVRTSLQTAQDNHDRELGLGWGGEVLAAARTGVIRDAAPAGEGQAVIEVELDASGVAVAARVRSASSPDGWRRVADALLAALRGRRIRGLDGSRGGRIALRLEARERMPSGASDAVKYCGTGACFDVSDVGAQKLRTINVSLERKERL